MIRYIIIVCAVRFALGFYSVSTYPIDLLLAFVWKTVYNFPCCMNEGLDGGIS